MFENKKYVIINASEVLSINFSYVEQHSAETLRYNKDKTKTFVKFEGENPKWEDEEGNIVDFFNDKTIYTHDEIVVELNKPEWIINE
tara:strand:- start:334 stop:594 length:261 start_codon:yes stop_codon:yes gene_type:complete